jgi:Leucine-rich repeat (LRR) protein
LLIITSFILKKTNANNRIQIEWILIASYFLFNSLYYVHFSVGTEIYFYGEKKPFIGKNQNFVIIFDVNGEKKLPNNFFSNNKIHIPENGIVLTSSKKEDYKQRYSFRSQRIMKSFATANFEKYNCFGIDNYKFEFLIGSVNEKGIIDYRFRDLIANKICKLLEEKRIKNSLAKGYENGKNYLEQKQVYINGQNLTELPNGLLKLKNIEYLNIHSNSFNGFPKGVYEFPKLKDLTIGFNEVDSIPNKIKEIKTLEYLAVNGNNLTDLPNVLLNLPKLETIYAQENKFDSIKIRELVKKFKEKGIEIQYE